MSLRKGRMLLIGGWILQHTQENNDFISQEDINQLTPNIELRLGPISEVESMPSKNDSLDGNTINNYTI